MSITWDALHAALSDVVKEALADAGVSAKPVKSDVKRPVVRRQVKIDLTDCSGSGDDDCAEWSYDAEIYFYPQNADRPRDECVTAQRAITNALRAGLLVDGFHIPIPGGIATEIINGVLVGTLTLEWLETAEDEGEPMEELYIREERDNGSNNASD